MKARHVSILVLAAALSAPALLPVSAAPQDTAVGYWASRITATRWNSLLERSESQTLFEGTSRAAVVTALGQPARVLSADVWVYDNCRPDQAVARERGCNVLVVTFADDKVAEMRFVNHPAVEMIAANSKVNRTDLIASIR